MRGGWGMRRRGMGGGAKDGVKGGGKGEGKGGVVEGRGVGYNGEVMRY